MNPYKALGKKFVVYQDNDNNQKIKIYEVSHSWRRYDRLISYIVFSSEKEFQDVFSKEAKTEWLYDNPDLEGELEILQYTFTHHYVDKKNYIYVHGFEVVENNVFDTLDDAEKFKKECLTEKDGVRFFYCGNKKTMLL